MRLQVRLVVVAFWAMLAVVCFALPWEFTHLASLGALVVALLAMVPAGAANAQSRR